MFPGPTEKAVAPMSSVASMMMALARRTMPRAFGGMGALRVMRAFGLGAVLGAWRVLWTWCASGGEGAFLETLGADFA